MIQPEQIELTRADGTILTVQLTKIPAIPAREIVTQYVSTAMPKVGDYEVNARLMRKLISYTHVVLEDGTTLPLNNDSLIDNHVRDWETLVKLEYKMLEYNTSFLKKLSSGAGIHLLLSQVKAALTQASLNTKSS